MYEPKGGILKVTHISIREHQANPALDQRRRWGLNGLECRRRKNNGLVEKEECEEGERVHVCRMDDEVVFMRF